MKMAILDELHFHPVLLEIDLSKITFFHLAYTFLFDLGISVFRPLPIRPIPYPFREIFRNTDVTEFQYAVMNNQFIEFARRKILPMEGYPLNRYGYHKKNGVIPDVELELYEY